MKAAKATDWQTLPLPAQRASFAVERTFSQAEIERIRLGLIPEEMEDKWFIYWQDDTLHLHRSWTGVCIYVLRFAEEGDAWKVTRAEVNRDPEQYSQTSDASDASLVSYLIDVLLLGRRAEFPIGDPASPESAISNWSFVGRAMFGRHPRDESEPD
jgi:hypothetical protein